MTPRELIEAFETLADAPDGVTWLRELVLQLAVRGKLVAQDPEAESATLLLHRLAPTGTEAPLSADVEAFDLPVGWVWATVADVGRDGADSVSDGPFGSKLKGEHYVQSKGYRVVRLGNVGRGTFKDDDKTYISGDYFAELHRYHLAEGDIIVASLGDPPGRACIIPKFALPAINKADCFRVRPHTEVSARYITIVLNSPFGSARSLALHRGDTRGRINLSHLRTAPLPLPPVAEQHRIVARVDELMGLLDRLEAARSARDEVRRAARDAALAALRDAEDAEAVQRAWTRISGQMDALFTASEDVAPLRQTIRQLGVQGRLVPQEPSDAPASFIIEQASQERQRALGPMRDTLDVPLDVLPPLPVGWSWVALGAMLLNIQAGWSPEAEKRPKVGDEWGVLKVSACSWGQFRAEENKALLPGTEPRLNLEVSPGDFLISRANTVDLVARSVVVDRPPPRLMLSDKTLRLVPTSVALVQYLNIANGSTEARRHYAENASGTSDSMRNVSQEAIRCVPIPLPPLAEQHRIVAKVDVFMGLCDALETQLTVAQAVQAQFAAAAVHHLDV